VVAAGDIVCGVLAEAVEQSKQAVGQLDKGALMDSLEDLEVLVRTLVHAREMHLLRERLRHDRLPPAAIIRAT
jgi:hypothetical protein